MRTLILLAVLTFFAATLKAQQWTGTGTNHITNTNSGNIGVGTSTPTAKLHVKGGQIIETEISGGTNTRTLTLLESGTGQIYFGAYEGSWRSSIQIQNNNATRGLFMAPPEADYGYSILRSISGGYKFDVGGNYANYGINAISIEESGNVKFPNSIGIGCDVQSAYKLAVNGDAIFTKVKVKQYNNWPDYVFSDGYKLPSLEEIRKYIQLNKHLPGVPSAKEVEENGLDLGNNQAILLKKIEELTLYLLDQDKKQAKQTEEFHALQQQLIQQQKEIEVMKQQLQTLLKK